MKFKIYTELQSSFRCVMHLLQILRRKKYDLNCKLFNFFFCLPKSHHICLKQAPNGFSWVFSPINFFSEEYQKIYSEFSAEIERHDNISIIQLISLLLNISRFGPNSHFFIQFFISHQMKLYSMV